MTEPDAVAWARKNGFDKIEKVPGSEKQYEYYGHFQASKAP
jgi:hypothetical protein